MGVTGTSAFPCCGKNAVDIVERTNDYHQQPHAHKDKEDEEKEPEAELPKLEPLPNMHRDPVPQLEEMKSAVVSSKCTPEAKGDYLTESSEQQGYRIESCDEELPSRPWSFKANSSNQEEEHVCDTTQFRSIPVQTSKHLFWSNKLIQASEHSLQQALEKHHKGPQEKKCVSIPQVLTDCAPLPSSPRMSCTSLPTAIDLADLINFASSLAVASSSNMNLPSLENMIKGTSEKSMETSIELCQPGQSIKFAQATQITQISSEKQEKPPEDMTTQKSWTQETKNLACSYLDFSKTGLKNATIQGEVKFVQAPTMSPQLQGANEEVLAGCLGLPTPQGGSPLSSTRPRGRRKAPSQASGSRGQKTKRSPSTLRRYPRVYASRTGMSAFSLPPRPPQKPRSILTREEQAGRMHKGRLRPQTGQLPQSELPSAMATKESQTILREREFKDPEDTQPYWSGLDTNSESLADDSVVPLTPRQLAAFQDVFKLFSCSPTGTVDMQSMKVALRNVGIQLGPQEMCEALRLADLDGDGIVSFKDFLGVLTDNYRFAQCMGQMKSNRASCEPPSLHTLFLEVLFKLLRQGFVPSKSGQEVTSYYSKKQRALRLSTCSKGRVRGQGRPARTHTGLTFFCQAARLSGLSSSQLARSLHILYRAGGRSPYAQIPNLAGRPRLERRFSNRAPGPDVRFPKPHQPSRPKLPPNLGPLSKAGPFRPPAVIASQPLEQMRPAKLASSPPTLVQKHPSSPSPACFQRCAMKSLYK